MSRIYYNCPFCMLLNFSCWLRCWMTGLPSLGWSAFELVLPPTETDGFYRFASGSLRRSWWLLELDQQREDLLLLSLQKESKRRDLLTQTSGLVPRRDLGWNGACCFCPLLLFLGHSIALNCFVSAAWISWADYRSELMDQRLRLKDSMELAQSWSQ